MKKTIKYTILLLGMSILFTGILFLVKPRLWMKITNPLHYEIVSVDTKIDNAVLDLNLGIVLNSHYLVDMILDSIHYEIQMDSTKFSEGSKKMDGNFDINKGDTLYLPLRIEPAKIQEVIRSNQTEDSLLLEIDFKVFVRLPIAGATSIDIPISKKVPVPNPPKFKVLNVEKKVLKLHDAVYELTFEIENPNHYEINIQSYSGVLNYPNLFSGKIDNIKGFYVKPYSAAQATTTIGIDDLELVRDGLKMLLQPKKEWAYTLDLDLKLVQQDSSILLLHITSEGMMPMKKNNKK